MTNNKPRIRKFSIIALLIALVAAIGGAYYALNHKGSAANAATNSEAKAKSDGKKSDAKKGETEGEKEPAPVELAKADLAFTAARDLGTQLLVSGTVRPVTQATVKSQVSADVTQVHTKEGERVTKGQLLISLNNADWRNRVLAQQAAVDEAKARLGLANKNQTSNQALRDKGFISQNAVDTTQNSVEVATASLKAAQAQLDLSKRQLDETSVRAPITGIVAKRFVQAGEKVTEQQSLIHIVDLKQMELEAQIPLSDMPSVKEETPIQFTVDGFEGRQFTGKVDRINPVAEAGTRSITLYIRVPNEDASLRAGMFASGRLKAAGRGPVPSLPMGALREEAGSAFVFAVVDEKIQRIPVDIGQKNIDSGFFELKSELAKTTPVIAVKSGTLKHGQKAILK